MPVKIFMRFFRLVGNRIQTGVEKRRQYEHRGKARPKICSVRRRRGTGHDFKPRQKVLRTAFKEGNRHRHAHAKEQRAR